MYETARELVAAERKLGIEAYIVDPRAPKPTPASTKTIMCPHCKKEFPIGGANRSAFDMPRPPAWAEDRGVCAAPPDFALRSDVIVSHSGLHGGFEGCKAPRVHIAHGRPNSSYRIERDGQTPIYKTYREFQQDERWKAIITLWPGYEDFWSLVFPRVEQFQPFVDLSYWTPGDTDYDFNGKAGSPNVVVADIWRMDKDPFFPINGFANFAESYSDAKLHLFGLDSNPRGRETLLDVLEGRGVLGQTSGMIEDLLPIYRAADIVITPHRIATRTVREALACGTQVVGDKANPYTPYVADMEDPKAYGAAIAQAWEDLKEDREGREKSNRDVAEREFDVTVTAEQFVELFEELTDREAA